ncbi:LysM peptidoglycan-binding domain-containing M23 family metallopeptidase [Paenibacillus sp. CAU 1782]
MRYKSKIVLYSALVLMVVFCSGFVVASQIKTVYPVSFNGELIGEISNPELLGQWLEQKEAEFAEQNPGLRFQTNSASFSFGETSRLNAMAQDYKVQSELNQLFEVKSFGVQVTVDGEIAGIVKNKDIAEQILDKLKEPYIVNGKDAKVETMGNGNVETVELEKTKTPIELKSVDFVEQISISSVEASPAELDDGEVLLQKLQGRDKNPTTYVVQEGDCISCIAQKFNVSQNSIYENNEWIQNDFLSIGDELDLTVMQPKISVKTEELYSETVSIPRGIEVVYDDSLRVGVSKVENPGKDGKKKLTYLVTKINGELVDQAVVEEETLEKAEPQKVIQGSKVIKGVGSGSFKWPITGAQITSKFGQRWGRLHAGTDAVSSDLTIYAADSGKVITAEYDSSYGNHIIVDHQNGYKTLYAHLSELNVNNGDLVEKGDGMGIMGTTGRSTGVHLHFEIHKGETRLNPMEYIE